MPLDASSSADVAEVRGAVSSTGVPATRGPLYADRVRVYPKSVQGAFRTIKWIVLAACLGLYYLVPWLRWARGPGVPDQAILIDLSGRRAYFLWIEIWPQEVYYLTGLLILAALGLFLATSLFGRLWCGYACPQTVWTDLFMLVERWIEGDRNARMKLDRQAMTAAKAIKKTLKHSAWLVIAGATGGAWVFYFADAPSTAAALVRGQASVEVYFFIALFTATTYLLAGWAREQVCTYMCPWPRFQGALLDENSLIVTYQAWRGETRGKHKAGQSWDGRGDCVDCRQCEYVCPVGIDIRNGPQFECIGCGLCIDACNGVMDKVERPRGLIKFDTLANQAAHAVGRSAKYKLLRPRVIIYAALLVIIGGFMLWSLSTRATVELSILRDRAPLYVTLSDGTIRNGYTLKILNKRHEDVAYALSVSGIASATVSVIGLDSTATDPNPVLTTKPDAITSYRVFVAAGPNAVASDSIPLSFHLKEVGGREAVSHGSVFIGPHR